MLLTYKDPAHLNHKIFGPDGKQIARILEFNTETCFLKTVRLVTKAQNAGGEWKIETVPNDSLDNYQDKLRDVVRYQENDVEYMTCYLDGAYAEDSQGNKVL